jgi:hypothetical protein
MAFSFECWFVEVLTVTAVAECESATAAVEAAATATKCRWLIPCYEALLLFIPVSSQDQGVMDFAER